MLLMIDNYDSFTYNLVQYFGELGEDVRVARNDQITLEEIAAMNPDRICVSPGPCSPAEAGISVPVIQTFAGKKPILGVCLGHQPSARPTAATSCARSRSCTARPCGSRTRARTSSPVFPPRTP